MLYVTISPSTLLLERYKDHLDGQFTTISRNPSLWTNDIDVVLKIDLSKQGWARDFREWGELVPLEGLPLLTQVHRDEGNLHLMTCTTRKHYDCRLEIDDKDTWAWKSEKKNSAQKIFSLGGFCSFQYNIIDQYQFCQNNIVAVLFMRFRWKVYCAHVVHERVVVYVKK